MSARCSTITIRRAGPQHAEAIHDISRACFAGHEHYHNVINDLSKGDCFVALDPSGQVVGYALSLKMSKGEVILESLAVTESWRNTGCLGGQTNIARRLFFAITAAAISRDARHMEWDSSDGALAFYRRLGAALAAQPSPRLSIDAPPGDGAHFRLRWRPALGAVAAA